MYVCKVINILAITVLNYCDYKDLSKYKDLSNYHGILTDIFKLAQSTIAESEHTHSNV